MPKFCRIGMKVRVNRPGTPEDGQTGIIRDLFSPWGRQTKVKDKKPPYFVDVGDRGGYWYEPHEILPANKKGSC